MAEDTHRDKIVSHMVGENEREGGDEGVGEIVEPLEYVVLALKH